MFADPQTVTVNAVAQTLAALTAGDNMSRSYRKDDGSYELVISHAEKTRNRRVVRLNHRKIAADPLTADNTEFSASYYLVIDAPRLGYTNTEMKDHILGLVGWLTSANTLKVLGGES